MFSFLSKTRQALGDKKTLKGILVFSFVLFLLLVPNISHAALFDIGFKVISKIWFGISYLIALLGGLVVAVLIIALQMIIQVSTGIVNSTPVQIGFPIVLSIANLGFVLAVIVIAVATILRQESYGIKKLLANVIIMAVLVNFGLVISGAIIGFSNRITTYFLDSMTGGVTDFASIMAGTMNPQTAFFNTTPVTIQESDEATSTVINIGSDAKDLSRLGGAAKDGGSFGAMLIPIFSVFLTIINVVIMIITLFILLTAFIVRYIKITFYLILLPAAWMASIFPGLKTWSGKWWSAFISQVFYPPVVIFFLWLAMRVAAGMSNNSDGLKFETVRGSGPFSAFLGDMIGAPLQAILQMVVIAGIMLGGDYAGKAIGVAGAGAATKFTEDTKKWATKKTKRAGLRTGLGAISGAKQAGSWVSKTKVGAAVGGFGKKITAIPGVGSVLGDVGKMAGTQARAWTARGEKAMSEEVSKDSVKDVSAMGEEELLIRAERATGLERAAMLERASKDPKLMAKLMKVPGFRDKMKGVSQEKDLYARYGFRSGHEEAMLQSGEALSTIQPLDAALKAEQAKATPDPAIIADLKAKMDKIGYASLDAVITKMSKDSLASIINGKNTLGLPAGSTQLADLQKSTMEALMKGNASRVNGVLQVLEEKNEAGKFTEMLHSSGVEEGQISASVRKSFDKGTLGSMFDEDELLAPALFMNTNAVSGARIKNSIPEIRAKLVIKYPKMPAADLDAKALKIYSSLP